MELPFDLSTLYDSISTQVILALGIVIIVMIVVAVVTQGWGKALATGFVGILLAGIIVGLKNIDKIGDTFSKFLFNTGFIVPIGSVDMEHVKLVLHLMIQPMWG